VAVVDVVDIGVPAIALTRRRAVQLAGTVATGVAVWVYVPALTRGTTCWCTHRTRGRYLLNVDFLHWSRPGVLATRTVPLVAG